MSGREFIDTNVLVYAHDARDPVKQARARAVIRGLMRECRGVLSLQVLQEFFAVATRKLGMEGEEAKRRVVLYSRFDVIRLSLVDLLGAIDLHRLHGLSFWDGLTGTSPVARTCPGCG